jgi:hypothetical protein
MSDTPTLIFPDAVALALAELTAQLPAITGQDIPVVNRVPSPRPPTFVRVRRQGGTRATMVTENATLAVEAWAEDAPGADDLAQACRAVLFSMAGRKAANGVPVYRVEDVGGPADVPDPLSDQPIAQFSVGVHVRGRTA